jgi:hypothetical protein
VTLVAPTLDSRFVRELPERLIGDRAYDADPLDEALLALGVEMIAPHRRGRKRPKTQDGRPLRRYKRRWQIEMSWRYGKSELALESPRLWNWERRQKLLLLATLAYAFLLSLLAPACTPVRRWLLHWWCHRTGKRSREASAPLYRLRSALSRLWLAYLPHASYPVHESSG